MAPDLVLLSHHGFDLKGSVQKWTTSGRSKLQGIHTYDDAFFFSDGGEYRFGEKIFANERRLVKSVY